MKYKKIASKKQRNIFCLFSLRSETKTLKRKEVKKVFRCFAKISKTDPVALRSKRKLMA